MAFQLPSFISSVGASTIPSLAIIDGKISFGRTLSSFLGKTFPHTLSLTEDRATRLTRLTCLSATSKLSTYVLLPLVVFPLESCVMKFCNSNFAIPSSSGIITKLLRNAYAISIPILYNETLHQRLFTGLLRFFTLYHGLKKAECVIATVLILQVLLTLPSNISVTWFISCANAVLYSPDTKVPRTGELALRRAIPANANMKAIQDCLEDISYLLRIPQRKPYSTMEGDVKKALKIAVEQKESFIDSCPVELKEKGFLLHSSLINGRGGLKDLIEFIKKNDPDQISVALQSSLDTLAELELLQAPGLSFLLPEQYLKYPRLTGRGIVKFIIEKTDGSTFFPSAGGEANKIATIQVVLDGYSAPLTAGNFAKLVIDGAYDGVRLNCTDQAVLSDNELENVGYSVPLEIKPSGEFEPLYKTALSIQDGELPVLPLSVYGALAMAHNANSEEYSSPSQFFFYLYDKRNVNPTDFSWRSLEAGLGGLSFDEGHFSVFGYTTVGRDVLGQINSGDLIRSAELVEGLDRLILPVHT